MRADELLFLLINLIELPVPASAVEVLDFIQVLDLSCNQMALLRAHDWWYPPLVSRSSPFTPWLSLLLLCIPVYRCEAVLIAGTLPGLRRSRRPWPPLLYPLARVMPKFSILTLGLSALLRPIDLAVAHPSTVLIL